MNKIRCFLATIALLATLGGPIVQGIASGSMANAAAIRSASSAGSSFATGSRRSQLLPDPTGLALCQGRAIADDTLIAPCGGRVG